MSDQNVRGMARLIEKVIAPLRATVDSLIERATVGSVSAGDGSVPTATVDGVDVQIHEPYGFASAAPGETIVLSPNGDDDDRVGLPVSSVSGRPAVASLDAVIWTTAGHQIYLANDGALTVTSKDGATIVMPASGKVQISAAALADIDLTVDVGQSVNIGDALAVALLKAQAAETYLVAAANAVTGTPDVEAGFTAFAAALAGLANAAGTTKAKGT